MTEAAATLAGGGVAPRFVPRSRESWRDPFTMYAQLRDLDPVHHVEAGDYWVLSRFEDVFAAARDTRAFSSANGLTFAYDDMAAAGLEEIRPMVMLDPPEHTVFRRVVSGAFTPRRVQVLESEVRRFVRARLDRLCDEGGGDVVAELLKPLPSMVVAHFLGVPEADRARFDGWTTAIVAASALGNPAGAAEAVTELFGYFSALVDDRKVRPGDDTMSQLAVAVPPMQALGFAFTMVTGGNDTTTGLLGGSLELLTEYPDERRALLSDPSLLPAAVEELLRLTSPVQGLARTTTQAVELQGEPIPAGRKVMLLFGSANRDPRQFGAGAADLDVRRDPKPILSFGYGAHHCLGAAAARLQARIALAEILGHCPRFAVDAARGEYAPGNFVRRYASLPFVPDG